jgi:hypothetical protein
MTRPPIRDSNTAIPLCPWTVVRRMYGYCVADALPVLVIPLYIYVVTVVPRCAIAESRTMQNYYGFAIYWAVGQLHRDDRLRVWNRTHGTDGDGRYHATTR